MDSSTKNFLQFNGIALYTLSNDAIIYIALKPICTALRVDWQAAHKRLISDEILLPVSSIQTMQINDDQMRKYVCLPERYVYGWLFSLNSNSEELKKYKLQCYDLLYNHFHGAMTARLSELRVKTEAEIRVEQLEAALLESDEYKELEAAKMRIKLQNKILKKLDTDLQKGQASLFGPSTLN